MRIWLRLLALLAVPLLAGPLHANPRALLIGVGDVRGHPLPGIDVDMENMKKTAATMGFKPADIKVLYDADATLANVRAVLSGWLAQGVQSDDHVLIYFSGHGTRIADAASPQGQDDALVMHDAQFVNGHVQGLLLGRELGAAIAKIPSRSVLVLIDACQSGSATRDLQLDNLSLGTSTAVKRFFSYPGMPPPPPPGAATRGFAVTRGPDVAANTENYAALSAAADNEFASGTEQGGMFTLGVVGQIQEAARNSQEPTVEDLRVAATHYIATHLNPKDASHPVADGNQRLIHGELRLIPPQQGERPTWQSLVALAGKGQPLKVVALSGPQVHLGDLLKIRVDVPRAGYLNVITVDSQDRATVLYPNEYDPSNQVAPGNFLVPTNEGVYRVRVVRPTGPTLVVAFLSDNKVNLLELGIEGRDTAGNMQAKFTEVSGRGTRALALESSAPQFAAGTYTVSVEPGAAH